MLCKIHWDYLAFFIAGLLVAGLISMDWTHKPIPPTPVGDVQVETTRNDNVELHRLLVGQSEELAALREEIRQAGLKPREVRTIIRETVVMQGRTETVPATGQDFQHVITSLVGVPVAQVDLAAGQYQFTSYDLEFEQAIFVGKKNTSAWLRVKSSGNPDHYYNLPAKVVVHNVQDFKKVEPHISVGVTGALPLPALRPSLGLSVIHPTENIDVLGLRASANNNSAAIGVDVAGYNLGSKLPVLTNTWVWAGVGVNDHLGAEAQLTIGGKL